MYICGLISFFYKTQILNQNTKKIMQQAGNKPHRLDSSSVVSESGEIRKVQYPILSLFPNQAARRSGKKSQRFYGESKNCHLTVTKDAKYLRFKQHESDKNGNRKVIEHYILAK